MPFQVSEELRFSLKTRELKDRIPSILLAMDKNRDIRKAIIEMVEISEIYQRLTPFVSWWMVPGTWVVSYKIDDLQVWHCELRDPERLCCNCRSYDEVHAWRIWLLAVKSVKSQENK